MTGTAGCRTCRDSLELLQRERSRALVAESRESAKERLITIVATESSATANSLLGWTEALRRDFAQQSARERALDLMEARITAHLAVLETLLDACGSAGGELSLVRLPLRDVVEGAVFSQRGFAAERSVRIPGIQPVNAEATVLGDRALIARSLRDLLAESIRVASADTIIDVELIEGPSSALVRLSIAAPRVALDEGCVGVAAARRAAAVHGGSLEVRAAGFLLRLPLFDPAPAPPVTPAVAKTLLVVRDEPEIAELFAALAIARGFHVLTVQDEELAARAFDVHDPDLVVLGSSDVAERMRALVPHGSDRMAVVTSAAQASALLRELATDRPGSPQTASTD